MAGSNDAAVAVEVPADARQRKRKSTKVVVDESKIVGTACEVRLISVNDVAETFVVALLIHVHFMDSSVKATGRKSDDDFMRDAEYSGFLPKILLLNCVEGGEFDVTVRINPCTGMVWAAFQTIAHINESLELQQFPFDRQLFRVGFKSPNAQFARWTEDLDILDFPDMFDENKSPNAAPYLVSCELNTWHMHSVRTGVHLDDADPVSLTKAEFELTIQAERDPLYFYNNLLSVIYLIVLFNAGSVAIEVESMGDRLAYGAGLLLTAVAFKFVLADTLPRVGYSTYFDRYIIVSFIFLGVGIIENMIVSPHVRCLGDFFGEDDAAIAAAKNAACRAAAVSSCTTFDGLFQLFYALLWTAVNVGALVAALKPELVRPSWDDVISSQIGETEETIRRTNVIYDLDAIEGGEKDALIKED